MKKLIVFILTALAMTITTPASESIAEPVLLEEEQVITQEESNPVMKEESDQIVIVTENPETEKEKPNTTIDLTANEEPAYAAYITESGEEFVSPGIKGTRNNLYEQNMTMYSGKPEKIRFNVNGYDSIEINCDNKTENHTISELNQTGAIKDGFYEKEIKFETEKESETKTISVKLYKIPENYDITYDEYIIKITVKKQETAQYNNIEIKPFKNIFVEYEQAVSFTPELSNEIEGLQYKWYAYNNNTKKYDLISQKKELEIKNVYESNNYKFEVTKPDLTKDTKTLIVFCNLPKYLKQTPLIESCKEKINYNLSVYIPAKLQERLKFKWLYSSNANKKDATPLNETSYHIPCKKYGTYYCEIRSADSSMEGVITSIITVKKVNHVFESKTTAPTIYKTGIEKSTCKKCKLVKEKEIPKLTPFIKLSQSNFTRKKSAPYSKRKYKVKVSFAKGDAITKVVITNSKVATAKFYNTNNTFGWITGCSLQNAPTKNKSSASTTVAVKLKSGLVKKFKITVK